MYNYLISYFYCTDDGDTGYGDVVANLVSNPPSYDDLVSVRDLIKSDSGVSKVVILNLIRLSD